MELAGAQTEAVACVCQRKRCWKSRLNSVLRQALSLQSGSCHLSTARSQVDRAARAAVVDMGVYVLRRLGGDEVGFGGS